MYLCVEVYLKMSGSDVCSTSVEPSATDCGNGIVDGNGSSSGDDDERMNDEVATRQKTRQMTTMR